MSESVDTSLDDVEWFVDQIRTMFPESSDLADAWQQLLTQEPADVLRKIVHQL